MIDVGCSLLSLRAARRSNSIHDIKQFKFISTESLVSNLKKVLILSLRNSPPFLWERNRMSTHDVKSREQDCPFRRSLGPGGITAMGKVLNAVEPRTIRSEGRRFIRGF